MLLTTTPLVARRVTREPLAYIVGHREFWGLDLEVNPAVLIPRPSTELIVEAILELFPLQQAPLNVVDVCTGCGCVAVALAHERPAAAIVATDISEQALAVARRNAVRHGVADRVSFRHGDLLAGIDGTFDAILANPPYVLDRARPALQPEVRDHEPSVALFGGADGMTLLNRLVARSAEPAAPGRLSDRRVRPGPGHRDRDPVCRCAGAQLDRGSTRSSGDRADRDRDAGLDNG